jgi:fucose permease
MAAFFAVTGLEATAGQWTFTLFTESRGMSTVAAGAWVGAFWTAFTISRVLAGFVVARVGSVRLTRIGALGMVMGAALLALSPTPALGGVGLVLVGFSIAPLFPGLMAETPRRLGAEAARHAVGFQVSAAILGAAAIPAMAGLLADRFGLEIVALAPLVAGLLFIAVHETLIATTDRAT